MKKPKPIIAAPIHGAIQGILRLDVHLRRFAGQHCFFEVETESHDSLVSRKVILPQNMFHDSIPKPQRDSHLRKCVPEYEKATGKEDGSEHHWG